MSMCVHVCLCAGFDQAYPTLMQYKMKLYKEWHLCQRHEVLDSAHQTLVTGLDQTLLLVPQSLSAQTWRRVTVRFGQLDTNSKMK